ncbi:hypothetical protein C8R45DRAFT_946049 [Mycena sanguinolenta]|nr:hypothetical protein C8R45DRAFT_946049 [Mycena sanguinolenta]
MPSTISPHPHGHTEPNSTGQTFFPETTLNPHTSPCTTVILRLEAFSALNVDVSWLARLPQSPWNFDSNGIQVRLNKLISSHCAIWLPLICENRQARRAKKRAPSKLTFSGIFISSHLPFDGAWSSVAGAWRNGTPGDDNHHGGQLGRSSRIKGSRNDQMSKNSEKIAGWEYAILFKTPETQLSVVGFWSNRRILVSVGDLSDELTKSVEWFSIARTRVFENEAPQLPKDWFINEPAYVGAVA